MHTSLELLRKFNTQTISLLGAGGSGKGTLGELLEQALSLFLNVKRIVVSDVIKRYENETVPTDLGNEIRKELERLREKSPKDGVIVENLNNALISKMMDVEIVQVLGDDGANILILDGFVRTDGQMGTFAGCPLLLMVYLVSDLKAAKKSAADRTARRRKQKLLPRLDDADWAVEARFNLFRNDLPGILQVYREHHTRKIVRIESHRYLAMKAVLVLKALGFDGTALESITNHFDNHKTGPGKFIQEIEFPEYQSRQLVA